MKIEARQNLWKSVSAFGLQLLSYALVVLDGRHSWSNLLLPFIVPGALLTFLLGGGMSMVDGLTPEWRSSLAFALGLLLNNAMMYGFLVLMAKLYRWAVRGD